MHRVRPDLVMPTHDRVRITLRALKLVHHELPKRGNGKCLCLEPKFVFRCPFPSFPQPCHGEDVTELDGFIKNRILEACLLGG